MATLRQFIRNIRRLGNNIEQNVNAEMIRTAILAQQVIILSTPVDTGRARANWIADVGTGFTGTTQGTDRSGDTRIQKNAEIIRRRVAGSRADIHISNNLPYIGALNAGSSAQAPAMFVEQGIAAAVAALRNTRVVRR